jgi:uncharacterized protein with HEPN domain
MSAREFGFRIEDILEAIERIEEYTAGLDFPGLKKHRIVIDAVVRNLEVIGEAANHVPDKVQDRYPEIPWSKMKGIRNILIHEYFEVDLEVVWNTVRKDLPGLKKLLGNVKHRP